MENQAILNKRLIKQTLLENRETLRKYGLNALDCLDLTPEKQQQLKATSIFSLNLKD